MPKQNAGGCGNKGVRKQAFCYQGQSSQEDGGSCAKALRSEHSSCVQGTERRPAGLEVEEKVRGIRHQIIRGTGGTLVFTPREMGSIARF